ncbi:unnamed protein product [Ranitomeya imitator]|uniref:RRM domain-containing protein n=1 Tax=Ranitomeya imitator TaxID=111125 RepID=A0ABN9M5R0_9NEOB|nr:unnamed protein product [Ranitomeya imitator]
MEGNMPAEEGRCASLRLHSAEKHSAGGQTPECNVSTGPKAEHSSDVTALLSGQRLHSAGKLTLGDATGIDFSGISLCCHLKLLLFFQRGSDELFSCVTNGPFIMSSSASAGTYCTIIASENQMEMTAKKFKGDNRSVGVGSKVIHVRKLPADVTEAEVIALGLPFGKVTNILMLKNKNQAFIEMNSEEAANTMVNYFATVTPILRSQPIYIQFSNHKELKTDNSPNQAEVEPHIHDCNRRPQVTAHTVEGAARTGSGASQPGSQRVQAALLAVNSVQPTSVALSAAATTLDAGMGVSGQSPVLRIIVENLFYPVTLDVLHQSALSGAIFLKTHCCVFKKMAPESTDCAGADSGTRRSKTMAPERNSIFSKFGTVLKIITFTKNNQFQALLQYSDPISAQHAKLSLDGQNIYNACCTLRIDFSKLTSLNVKYNNDKSRDYTRPDLPSGDGQPSLDQTIAAFGAPGLISANPYATAGFPPAFAIPQGVHGTLTPLALPTAAAAAAASRLGIPGLGIPGNSVLLVSNLSPERVTPQCLFILFGVYGDVHRVKILFNKKENALVQMADGNQAQLAMSHLNGQRLHGKPLRITLSKHQSVQLPKEGQEDQGLTKDYTNSPLHRFKKPGSKNFQNIFPPSATLHLSNIPPSISEEDIKGLFSNDGCTVKGFKFFQKDRKMALIQMGSVEEAIESVIELHNHDMGENHHLRVSFSKSTI